MFKVATLSNIPVYIDSTWLILLSLITFFVAPTFYPLVITGISTSLIFVYGFISAIGATISILLHELGHALKARSYKIKTRRIVLFALGGAAEIESEPQTPKEEFMVAIAGPVISLILAGIFFVIASIIPLPVAAIFLYLAIINIILGVFNLIPAFPLDGGLVLHSLIWKLTKDKEKASKVSRITGKLFGSVLVILGVVKIFSGLFIDGIWSILMGVFIIFLAS